MLPFRPLLHSPRTFDRLDNEDAVLLVYSDFDLLPLPYREATISGKFCWNINEEFVVSAPSRLCRTVDEATLCPRDHVAVLVAQGGYRFPAHNIGYHIGATNVNQHNEKV